MMETISKKLDSLNIYLPTVLIIAAVVLIILSIISFIRRRGKFMIIMGIIALLFGGSSIGAAVYTAPLMRIPQYFESYNNISSKIKETGKIDKKSEEEIVTLNSDIDKAEDIMKTVKKVLSKTPLKNTNIDIDNIEQYLKGTPFEGKDISSLMSLKMDPEQIQQALENGQDLNEILPKQ